MALPVGDVARVLSLLSATSVRLLACDDAREIQHVSTQGQGKGFRPAMIPTIIDNLETVMPRAIEGCCVAGEPGKQYRLGGAGPGPQQVMGKHIVGAALK